MSPVLYFPLHPDLHWMHLGHCWALACSLWSAGLAWTLAVFPVRKFEMIICNNSCRWCRLKAWFVTILSHAHPTARWTLCSLPGSRSCHVQTQNTNDWENALPGLLPSFQSKALTGILHVHPGAWQAHSEGWFFQQAPAAIASLCSCHLQSSSLQLATPTEKRGYSAELTHIAAFCSCIPPAPPVLWAAC